MQWKQRLKTWVVPRRPLAAGAEPPRVATGMYHYQRARESGYIRFHLRVERSGESLLIAGASEALKLSRAGTAVAKRLLDGEPAVTLAEAFQAGGLGHLVSEVVEMIEELGSPSSRFPIFNLSDPVDDPRDADLMAPFQADVELTARDNVRPILQKLWDAGIPHVRFLPAAELSDQRLLQAVEWAEDLGMIAGVRATASWLFAPERIAQLAAVGTDYVLTPWAVDDDLHAGWFGADDLNRLPVVIERVCEFEMTPVIEIPLVPISVDAFEDRLSQLVDWNVSHAEVYALARIVSNRSEGHQHLEPDSEPDRELDAPDVPFDGSRLRQVATWIEETADDQAFHLTWLPPVAVTAGEACARQVRRGPRAGGDVSIRVLANGDVLPPRGAMQAAGNVLTDAWPEIWGGALFRDFRARVEANTRCAQCPGLAICAADCPADPVGWSHD